MADVTCLIMFLPQPTTQENIDDVANPHLAIAASLDIDEKTPAVSIEDVRKTVVAQIEKIQEIIRFAQTVRTKHNK